MNVQKLLIIGNGFDLQCGLPSTFKDFIDNSVTKQKEKKFISQIADLKDKKADEIIGYVNNVSNFTELYFREDEKHGINFWIYILLLKVNDPSELSGTSWTDIETTIYEFLEKEVHVPATKENLSIISFEDLPWKNGELSLNSPNGTLSDHSMLTISSQRYSLAATIIVIIISIQRQVQVFNMSNSFINYIFEELKNLETDFQTYLETQINDEYQTKANKLLNALADNKKFNLLSFNYTSPENVNDNCAKTRHVHGSLLNHPIMGINPQLVDPTSKNFHFTKLSRIFSSKESGFTNTQIFDDSINQIMFYGHSLTQADWNYFFSIFDHFNIYSSNIPLVFYYSIYDNADREMIQTNTIDSVMKLLSAYAGYNPQIQNKVIGSQASNGATNTNPVSHFAMNNLISKLTLENRLRILPLSL
ncbi:AbiH family protein [Secundilactobacillus paracollinoides]|uniref:Bacteriophage abortive infection AbiH n=1 Tax=Secundilactobacillus paracollinoides TaxID=240427 RepID=A0A1B2IVE1_9LACO|nr:AbiH family protein [Secundilactobacillus paracollinoides]ANZ66007.1 hypothetical protein AYR63_01850 [Secundilactobacillus paracollinoides]